MPVTEIVDVLRAKGFMPTKEHVQRVMRDNATRWNYSLLLDVTRNHRHREMLPTKCATIIKPCHRHHIPDVFSFDRTRRKDEPLQIGGALLVKLDCMKDLGTHRTERQSLNTAKNLHVDRNGD